MAFTDATDDSVSDSFARLKKASQKPKEPRVELAQAATTTSDAGGGQKAEISPFMAKAKAEGEKATLEAAEAQYKRQQSEGKAAAEKARQAAIYEEYKPQLTQKFEPFQAPKETFASLAGLGVMLMAIGSMGGKKGLTSATGAMNAIAGMATGYQQGKKEEFDRQKAIFDENFRIMKENQAVIQKEFEYALKYAQRDVSGATTRLATTLKSLGLEAPATALKNGTETIQSAAEKTLSPMAKGLNEVQKKKLEIDQNIREAEAKIKEREQERKEFRRPTIELDKDGKPFMADPITGEALLTETGEVRRPGTAAGIKASSATAGEASPNSLQFRYNNAVSGASYRLASSLANVIELPTFAKAPGLSEMIADPAKGLTGAAERYLAGKTTAEEDRAWQQESARLLRAAGAIEAGGRPGGLTATAIKEYGNELVKPGDARINKVLSMALLKQELDFAVKELKVSGASKEQIALAEQSKAQIDKLIPYSVSDINRIIRGGKSPLAGSIDKNLIDSVTSTKDFDNRMKVIDKIKEIPMEAKELLLSNPTPENKAFFDQQFGKGAAFSILGR